LKDRASGKNSATTDDGELPIEQSFPVDFQIGKSPVEMRDRCNSKLKGGVREPVPLLKVVRGQEHTLTPQNLLVAIHGLMTEVA